MNNHNSNESNAEARQTEDTPQCSDGGASSRAEIKDENSSITLGDRAPTKSARTKKGSPTSKKKEDGKGEGGGWKRIAKIAIALIVSVFLIATVRQAVLELQAKENVFDIRNSDWRFLAIAIATYFIALIPPAVAWLWVLDDFRQRMPRKAAFHAFFLGHLGKYVPGKAMVLVLRVGKLQPYGLGLRAGIVSVFVETLTSVCVAAVLGGTLLLFLDVPVWLKWCAGACIPITLLAMTPHFFRIGLFAIGKNKIGKMPPPITNAFTGWFMIRTNLAMLLAWLLMGTSGWFVFLAISPSEALWSWYGWAGVVSAVCLGAVAGFASMLPGGAVVREIVITWLLEPIVGQPIALLGSILFRLVQILAECLIIGVFFSSKVEQKLEATTGKSETK